MKTIIVEPFAGLANRMRVIASGLALQQTIHARLTCVWNETEELNAPFEKLFKSIPGLDVISNSDAYKKAKASNQNNFLKKAIASFINKRLGIDYCIKDPVLLKSVWESEASYKQLVDAHTAFYFYTCEQFGNAMPYFSTFKPVDEIQSKIDGYTRLFNSHTTGIHIRRTDNVKSIAESPVEMFIAKIDKELLQNPSANFYLSTDDAAVEKELIKKYESIIIFHPKEQSRTTLQGMQDAVVDLFCLSATSKIIGSYWSSFSDIAALIHGIHIDIVKK